MKKTAFCIALIFCLLTAVLTVFAACEHLEVGQIKLMSFNVRRIMLSDTGDRQWDSRSELLVKSISAESATIIGMQEVTPQQYEFLQQKLSKYDSVITYRDDTVDPEACPIFYRKDFYTQISTGTFWLSETPDEMSIDWGAEYYRICTYVVLRDNRSQKEFAVFNTHLDNRSQEARTKGLGVIVDKIKSFGNYPVVVMGDFNSTEDSETYKKATETFWDVKYQVENEYLTCATYQNWGAETDNAPIDYFFISKTGFAVDSYEVVTNTYDGVYVSDHFPIVTKLTLTD